MANLEKTANALVHYASVEFVGDPEVRKGWKPEDYAHRIKSVVAGGFLAACVLMREVKEKFFASNGQKGHWKVYVENVLSMSYGRANDMVNIADRVLPFIDAAKAEELGYGILAQFTHVKEPSDRQRLLGQINSDAKVDEVRDLLQAEGHIKTKSTSAKLRLTTPAKIVNMLVKLNDALTDMLPCSEDSDELQHDKRQKLTTFKEDVNEQWQSLKNIVEWMLTNDSSKLQIEKIPSR